MNSTSHLEARRLKRGCEYFGCKNLFLLKNNIPIRLQFSQQIFGWFGDKIRSSFLVHLNCSIFIEKNRINILASTVDAWFVVKQHSVTSWCFQVSCFAFKFIFTCFDKFTSVQCINQLIRFVSSTDQYLFVTTRFNY